MADQPPFASSSRSLTGLNLPNTSQYTHYTPKTSHTSAGYRTAPGDNAVAESSGGLASNVQGPTPRFVPLATTGENREVLNHLFADVSLGFAKLNLSPTIHHALVDMGFDKPTKLQMLLLSNIPPSGIEHHYTLQAGFGSGKSTGCLMVIMSEIERRLDHLNGKCHHKTGAIIIAPTRALVDQLVTDMRAIAKGSKATIGKFVGQTYNTVAADAERLKSCHVAICTPDRLARMGDVDQRYKKGIFENVDLLVIDEASEMEGKQWEDGIAYLKSLTARFQKTWLVILSTSNELDMEAKHSLKKRLVEDAEIMVKIKVPKDDATKAICSMMEFFVFDNVEEKDHWLQDVITVKHNSNSLEQTIVFVNSKRHTELMDTALFRAGIPCNFIHGGVNNEEVVKRLNDFKRGEIKVLLMPGGGGKGLNLKAKCVVILDLPTVHGKLGEWLQRVARVGRMGHVGEVITVVDKSYDYELVQAIREYLVEKHGGIEQLSSSSLSLWTAFGGEP